MIGLLNQPPIPRPVPLGGAWRPGALGQLVTVDPTVKVDAPINIELGGLPLSLGLFGGSALMFLMRSELPAGLPRTVTMLLGLGLTVGGVVNLLVGGTAASAATSEPPTGADAPPGAPGSPVQQPPFVTPPAAAFAAVEGRIIHPKDTATINIGPTAGSYPVRIQLHNPSDVTVNLPLELTSEEEPNWWADDAMSSLPIQAKLGPGQSRNIDVQMPTASWEGLVDYMDVTLTLYKRRALNEAPVRLDFKSFAIE